MQLSTFQISNASICLYCIKHLVSPCLTNLFVLLCVLLLDLSVLFPLKSDLYVFVICFPISHVLMFFLQTRVDYMSVDDTREAIKQVSRVQPSFLLKILDKSYVSNGRPGPEQPHADQPSWRSCSYCREMPTQQERLCCKREPLDCHSKLLICLQQYTLERKATISLFIKF